MSKRKSSIDEDEMRRILGREGPLLDAPPTVPEPSNANISIGVPASPGSIEPDVRRRRMAIPDFEETFLKPQDIRNRSALYVSGETKRKVLEVVRMIGSDRMTATSYLENIIQHHLALYKDDINRLYQERKFDTLL